MCRHSNTEDQTSDLIATIRHIETMWLEWRRTLQTGVKVRQQRSLSLYRKSKVFRVYNPTVVWGTLQTAEYAAAVFRQVVDFFEIPDDIDAGVAARMERQQFLYRGGRGRSHDRCLAARPGNLPAVRPTACRL